MTNAVVCIPMDKIHRRIYHAPYRDCRYSGHLDTFYKAVCLAGGGFQVNSGHGKREIPML